MNKIYILPMLALFINVTSTYGTESSVSEEFYFLSDTNGNPIQPYSSSYLQLSKGDLTSVTSVPDSLPLGLPKSVVSNAAKPVLDRFFEIRKYVLNETESDSELKRAFTPKPNAAPWMGFCHAWSAASLDPTIAKLIQNSDGILCNGIPLTNGELRELFTAFGESIAYGPTKVFGPTNADTNPQLRKIHSELGRSELDANVFESVVIENLKRNRGVVINYDPAGEIWNFPVFSASFRRETFSTAKDLLSLSLVPRFPSIYFTALQGASMEQLNALKKIDSDLIGSERYISHLSKSEIDRKLEKRKEIVRQIEDAIDNGEVHIRQGISVILVHATLSFAVESEYREGLNAHRKVIYKYLLITDDSGRAIASSWVDQAEKGKRPAAIWVPARFEEMDSAPFMSINSITPLPASFTALRHLIWIMESEKCTPLKKQINE